MKPTYIINGFLESGKSEFIIYTMSQPYFQIKGKTLLILCEEGETEYDETVLLKTRTEIELLDKENDFTPEKLTQLETKYKPERIIIEYNGMWNSKNMKLPRNWSVQQQITTIDASTFLSYYTNMRSLFAEMIKKSEMIIFNRCDKSQDLNYFKRNIKAINQKTDIIFEDADGEVNSIMEDELPYDLQSNPIVLSNEGYGIWYLDTLDNLERYIGKTVQFIAMVAKPEGFSKEYFVPGRMAMTCCADDMVFLGYVCKYDKAETLQKKQWVRVTAEVHKEYWADYKGEGPILYAISVESTDVPKEEIISFS
jgi:uncharacterized membrane protein YcgQ (UPF0703/DUF1980 family)